MGRIPPDFAGEAIPDLAGVRPWDYALGGHGRALVDGAVLGLASAPVMLEIGCFLGASARRWLALRADLRLVALDPWDDENLLGYCERAVGRPALTRAYPDPHVQQDFIKDIRQNGVFKTALANLADFSPRFYPYRAASPQGLDALYEAGLIPDLIYIDADKKMDDLIACHRLWPQAILAGDDWHWGRTKGYPMRQIVQKFAADYGFEIEADHATWLLRPALSFSPQKAARS